MRLGLGTTLSVLSVLSGAPTLPSLTSLSSATVYKDGGDSVTITGTDLGSATACKVGVTSATITANTSTSLTFTMPVKASGSYNVVVTTSGGDSNALPIEAWSPADLALSVYLKPSFVASPWVGAASAGTSVGRNASDATHPPTVGTALNGYAPADFGGTNQKLTIADTMNEVVGGASFSGVALLKLRSLSVAGGVASRQSLLCSATSNRFAVYFDAGPTVHVEHLDASFNTPDASKAIALSAYAMVHWKCDGVNLQIGVNGSWGTAVASGATFAGNLTFAMQNAESINVDAWADMLLMEMGCLTSVISDANITKWRSAASCRYSITV